MSGDVLAMPNNKDNPLSHLGFQRFEPSINLSTIVECYWFINSDNLVTSDERLHPSGGMGIILNYGDALQFDGVLNNESCILDGTNTLSRKLRLKGAVNAVGIRFKPAGAHLLFSLPLNEIKNETISLAHAMFKTPAEFYDKLIEAQTFHLKIAIIENWLCHSLRMNKNISNIVLESMRLIKNHKGLLPIKSVASQLDYNPRRIERQFNSQVGMTLKEYSHILRIEQARVYIKNNNNDSYAAIAHDLGYYDQSHFVNQFKKVEGVTPREYSNISNKERV